MERSSSHLIQVEIYGQSYNLRGEGDTSYLQELAGAFHRYYNLHRILADDRPTALARLALVRAVRLVLRSALDLVGVGIPERM